MHIASSTYSFDKPKNTNKYKYSNPFLSSLLQYLKNNNRKAREPIKQYRKYEADKVHNFETKVAYRYYWSNTTPLQVERFLLKLKSTEVHAFKST